MVRVHYPARAKGLLPLKARPGQCPVQAMLRLLYCSACPRIVVFNVDAYPEAVPVPAFGPRMVGTGCGMIGADARPNWRERCDPGPITRGH